MNILKGIKKGVSTVAEINSNKELFRALSYKERFAAEIFDFRDILNQKPNNNIMITCEHATNNVHQFKLNQNDSKFLETHWGYDPG